MKQLGTALIVEWIKMHKSKIFWLTLGIFLFISFMMSLIMYISLHPDVSSKFGIIGTKAEMFGENDWTGYFNLFNQLAAAIGLIASGFITAWIYGREYSDRTLKDLLAVPLSRDAIAIAKFIVVLAWSIILLLILVLSGIAGGFLVGIPGWSGVLFTDFLKQYFSIVFLTLILCTPVAFITVYSRGYLAPLGFVILTMIMAQFASIISLGPWFPWAIPGLLSVPEGTPGMELHFISYILLALTGIVGLSGTLAWWRYADQY